MSVRQVAESVGRAYTAEFDCPVVLVEVLDFVVAVREREQVALSVAIHGVLFAATNQQIGRAAAFRSVLAVITQKGGFAIQNVAEALALQDVVIRGAGHVFHVDQRVSKGSQVRAESLKIVDLVAAVGNVRIQLFFTGAMGFGAGGSDPDCETGWSAICGQGARDIFVGRVSLVGQEQTARCERGGAVSDLSAPANISGFCHETCLRRNCPGPAV